MIRRFIAGSVFASALVAAQGTGAKPPSTGGGATGGSTGTPTGGTIGAPSLTSTTSRLGTSSTTPGLANKPIFLTGKVTLSDGTPPGEPVRIQRVCNGNPHSEGFTDAKGDFSIQLGQNREEAMPDASETTTRGPLNSDPNGGFSESRMNNCELRAVLAGFRSDVVTLATRRYMDNPDIGTIVLHRAANVEGLTISATSALAPKDAQKAYEKGLSAMKDIRPDDAQKEFEKAVAIHPRFAAAWLELGRSFEQRDRMAEARNAYHQSIAADSKFISPYQRLYILAVRETKWQEVADITNHIIHLNPYDFPDAFYFNGLSNFELNKLDIAEKSAREALKLDGGHLNPKTNYVLGLILARKKDFQAAAVYLRAFLKEAGDSKDAQYARKQLAYVEKYAQAKTQ